MLTALILICSLSSGSDAAACTEQNAVQVLRSPETFASPVACLMHGQAYLANSAIGRDLNEGETVKVICKRNRVTAAAGGNGRNQYRARRSYPKIAEHRRVAWMSKPGWRPPAPPPNG
jgi:GH24 family phage-related lysozyme (muramidase)